MKKVYFILTAFALTISCPVKAQLINMNPDPNGPVWITVHGSGSAHKH